MSEKLSSKVNVLQDRNKTEAQTKKRELNSVDHFLF